MKFTLKYGSIGIDRFRHFLPPSHSEHVAIGVNNALNLIDFDDLRNEDVAKAKKYVDDAKAAAIAEADAAQSTADSALSKANAALPMDGTGTMTGALNMGGKQITNMAAPIANTDATTKKYVDDAIAAGIKANDAMTFKGTVGGNGATVSALPTTAQKGDTYKVAAKGKDANIEAKVGKILVYRYNLDYYVDYPMEIKFNTIQAQKQIQF